MRKLLRAIILAASLALTIWSFPAAGAKPWSSMVMAGDWEILDDTDSMFFIRIASGSRYEITFRSSGWNAVSSERVRATATGDDQFSVEFLERGTAFVHFYNSTTNERYWLIVDIDETN